MSSRSICRWEPDETEKGKAVTGKKGKRQHWVDSNTGVSNLYFKRHGKRMRHNRLIRSLLTMKLLQKHDTVILLISTPACRPRDDENELSMKNA